MKYIGKKLRLKPGIEENYDVYVHLRFHIRLQKVKPGKIYNAILEPRYGQTLLLMGKNVYVIPDSELIKFEQVKIK
jgi:hypothetical protein